MTEGRPDLLLITPLIELGSPQLDLPARARRHGIRSALCVWSWDHLSSKALIRVRPDAVLVWNEIQRDEAAQFHGIPPERVHVTGAQCFDRWFDRPPSRGRAEFCRRAGLPDDRPFILYVCSALFRGSPSEAAFVRRWVGDPGSRAMHGAARMRILVRPHPQRLDEWQGQPPLEGAVLWGSNPIDEDGRADYFDSLYHSAAVVGLNTSALVEAAIVDRPVFTVLAPEFHENQEGTFHFHHLMTVGDGFLHTARGRSTSTSRSWRRWPAARRRARNAPFVERFIRPRGRGGGGHARCSSRPSRRWRRRRRRRRGRRRSGPTFCDRWCTLWCSPGACRSSNGSTGTPRSCASWPTHDHDASGALPASATDDASSSAKSR